MDWFKIIAYLDIGSAAVTALGLLALGFWIGHIAGVANGLWLKKSICAACKRAWKEGK